MCCSSRSTVFTSAWNSCEWSRSNAFTPRRQPIPCDKCVRAQLIDVFKDRLHGSKTFDELALQPKEHYAEVAALYEYCYEEAKRLQDAARQQQEAPLPVHAADAKEADAKAPESWIALVRFPWRIAGQELLRMKHTQMLKAEHCKGKA